MMTQLLVVRVEHWMPQTQIRYFHLQTTRQLLVLICDVVGSSTAIRQPLKSISSIYRSARLTPPNVPTIV